MPECYEYNILLFKKIFQSRGREGDTYSQRFFLPLTVRLTEVGGSLKMKGLCKHW